MLNPEESWRPLDMSQIEMQRMAAMMTFTESYGMAPAVAAAAAMALHPLDDSPVPSRAFEKRYAKLHANTPIRCGT
jgi:hypothetical protein